MATTETDEEAYTRTALALAQLERDWATAPTRLSIVSPDGRDAYERMAWSKKLTDLERLDMTVWARKKFGDEGGYVLRWGAFGVDEPA